jgi:hypothetical protein
MKKARNNPFEMTAEQFRRKYVDQEEHGLQARFVEWFRLTYRSLKMIAIPNGGLRDPITAAKLKAEGVETGAPDLLLIYAHGEYHGLWIEMKTINGAPSPEQLIFHAYLRSQNYAIEMPQTLEEAQQAVFDYLR